MPPEHNLLEAGIDKVDLSNTEIEIWNDLVNNGDGDFMTQAGAGVVILTSGTDSVYLENVQLSSLTADDFIF